MMMMMFSTVLNSRPRKSKCPDVQARYSDLIGPRVGEWVRAGSWLTGQKEGLKTPQVILSQ